MANINLNKLVKTNILLIKYMTTSTGYLFIYFLRNKTKVKLLGNFNKHNLQIIKFEIF